MLGCNTQDWLGLEACRDCRDIVFSVFALTPGRDRVTKRTPIPGPFPQFQLYCIKS